jgi:prepilin-type N-terminal cleavage/methylation domain-containing protein
MRKHTPCGGFTLLEMVAAIAVAAILGTALLSFVSASGNLYKSISSEYRAENEARIALSYVTIKVRQNDFTYCLTGSTEPISSVKLIGEDGQVLTSSDGHPAIESRQIKIISSSFVESGMSDENIADAPIWKIGFDKTGGRLFEVYYSNQADYDGDYNSDPGDDNPESDIAINLDDVGFAYDPDERLLSISIKYTPEGGSQKTLEGKVYLRSE